jgi:hypothetical protein
MLRWTRLEIFEWNRVKVFKGPDDPSPDPMAPVYDRPIDGLTLPEGADSIPGESFECLTSPDRFKNGDVVVVCHDEGTIMGYAWLSFKDLWVSESRVFLSPADNEVVVYDTFIFPQYRGRRIRNRAASTAPAGAGNQDIRLRKIQPVILRMASTIQSEVWRRGRKLVITYVETDNRKPMKTNQHLGGSPIMSLYSMHLFDRFSLHWATGQPFKSRFHR